MPSDRPPMTVAPHYPDRTAGRFARTIQTDSHAGCRVALLGLADDAGVALNNGRPGAQHGPMAIRRALAGYGTAQSAIPNVFDAGDIEPGGSIHETHDRVTEAAAWLLDRGLFPIGLGGGHDLTFPLVRAVAQREQPLTGVYCDPHLDVRAEVGSGMPFRALVEQCGVRELHIHGFNQLVNSEDHIGWFTSHGGHIDRFEPTDPWPNGALFFSFDLDVMDQAFAPGVSAPNPCGWTPSEAERWVYAAGKCDRVACCDFMELSPPNDREINRGVGQTARLTAYLLLTFLRGFSERSR